MSNKKRIAWVDIAKGIAIAAIIIGHISVYLSPVVPIAHNVVETVYSFHVAAFFILSGYTMKRGFMGVSGIAKLAKSCFLPYIVFGVISAVVCMLLTEQRSFIEWSSALIYGAALYKGELLWSYPFGAVGIGAVWFLPALFVGKLISSAMTPLPKVLQLILGAGAFGLGIYTSDILFLPFGIQQGLCACWFITVGHIFATTNLFDGEDIIRQAVLGMLATAGVAYMYMLGSEIWREPNYCISFYPNGWMDMIGTVAASAAVMLASVFIGKLPEKTTAAIQWVGKNTLPIFCWHAVFIAPTVVLETALLDFAAAGLPVYLVYLISLAVAFAFAIGLTAASKYIPGLRQVCFPKKKLRAEKQMPHPEVHLIREGTR